MPFIVLSVEFSRLLAGKNLYNNPLQSTRAEFITLKGIFIQNEPNLNISKCRTSSLLLTTNDQRLATREAQNKPNLTQSNPILTQSNPIKTQSNPIFSLQPKTRIIPGKPGWLFQ